MIDKHLLPSYTSHTFVFRVFFSCTFCVCVWRLHVEVGGELLRSVLSYTFVWISGIELRSFGLSACYQLSHLASPQNDIFKEQKDTLS